MATATTSVLVTWCALHVYTSPKMIFFNFIVFGMACNDLGVLDELFSDLQSIFVNSQRFKSHSASKVCFFGDFSEIFELQRSNVDREAVEFEHGIRWACCATLPPAVDMLRAF